jgi:hypothetical protein
MHSNVTDVNMCGVLGLITKKIQKRALNATVHIGTLQENHN